MMEKFWMIVDVTRWQDADNGIDMILKSSSRPRYCNFVKSEAEERLLRLRKTNPKRSYVLLEAVAFAEDGRTWKEIHIEPITE